MYTWLANDVYMLWAPRAHIGDTGVLTLDDLYLMWAPRAHIGDTGVLTLDDLYLM